MRHIALVLSFILCASAAYALGPEMSSSEATNLGGLTAGQFLQLDASQTVTGLPAFGTLTASSISISVAIDVRGNVTIGASGANTLTINHTTAAVDSAFGLRFTTSSDALGTSILFLDGASQLARANLASGGAYAANVSTTPQMTDDNWVQVTNNAGNLFVSTSLTGVTFASDQFTVPHDGRYVIAGSVSFSGANTDVYEFAFGVEGAVVITSQAERSTTNNSVGNVGVTMVCELKTSDTIDLRIRNTANDNDVTIEQANMSIFQVAN